MIAFVRSVTRAGISAGSMLRSAVADVAEDGRRAAVLDHVRRRGPGDRARDHLVARADADREQRQVERRRARGDGEDVLGLEVGGHPLLEQRGPRPGRQPARAQGLGDGGDLLLPDRGRLEAEPGATRGSHRPGSVRPAPHGEPARGRRRGRRPSRGSHRPGRRRAAAARSAIRAAGRSAPTRRPRRPRPPRRPPSPRSTPSGATRKRTHAPPTGRIRALVTKSSQAIGSPRANETARSLRSTPRAARQSSASWPPPSRAATSTTYGLPPGPSRIWV